MADEKNYFKELLDIDVSPYIEKKNGLDYISWARSWSEVKKRYPDSTYTIYENKDGLNYFTDGKTCWVKTGATVNGIEHIEYLPVMDYRNKSIPVNTVTSFDINKAIQRSLTKFLCIIPILLLMMRQKRKSVSLVESRLCQNMEFLLKS